MNKRFRLRYQSHHFELPSGEFVIGRSADAQLSVDDPLVSRRHARFSVSDDETFIEDLGSRNGVLLNSAAVVGRQRCTHGDRVTVGSQEIVVINTQKVPEQRHQRAPNITLGGDATTPLRHVSDTDPEGPALRVTQEIARADVAKAVARVEQGRSEGAARAEGREEPTRKADALQMLGGLADKALALGRAEEAERILSQLLHHTLAVAKTGAAVTPERADLVARYAVKLAEVFQPDVGGDVVGPGGFRDAEPSRADGGLTLALALSDPAMTRFYTLLAALAIFAPVAFAAINQAALVIA